MITVIESTTAGFFANFCDVIRHIIRCEERGEQWYVNWGSDSPYYSADRKEESVWDYYFKQPLSKGDLVDKQLTFVRGYTEIDQTGEEFRAKFNDVITRCVHLRPEVQETLDRVLSTFNIGKHTIGVHYRGTDKHLGSMFGEPSSARVLPAYRYTDEVVRILKGYPQFTNIFIATDESFGLNVMCGELKDYEFCYTEVVRGDRCMPVHSNFNNSTYGDVASGYQKGMEVLLDMLILSKCGYLIRSTSNVSSTAQFFNLDLCHYNINEVWFKDDREVAYGLTTYLPADESIH